MLNNPKFNAFEDFEVPAQRAWVIEWEDQALNSDASYDLIVTGKYSAKNLIDTDGKLKAKAGKTALVWLFAGATVGFANQGIASSVQFTSKSADERPPIQLPSWIAPTIVGLLITLLISWVIIDAIFGEPDAHWQKAAEELKRPNKSK